MLTQEKVAIVTGAGSGIGMAAALRLAKDGMAVAVADKDMTAARLTADAIARNGGSAVPVLCDVSEPEPVAALFDTVAGVYGRLDCFVACAGVYRAGRLLDTSLEEWKSVMDVNYDSLFTCTPRALAEMRKHGQGGSLIYTLSDDAFLQRPAALAYSVSAWGVRGFLRSMALHVAKERITVNGVAPGFVETPMAVQMADAYAKERGIPAGAAKTEMLAAIPMGRSQPADEVAAVYSYLAGTESRTVTGCILNCNGGTAMV